MNTLPSPHEQSPTEYWNSLIDEDDAAKFLSLSKRTLQKFRNCGGGPQYIRISSRCIRYRRDDLRAWSEERAFNNTSEYLPAATNCEGVCGG